MNRHLPQLPSGASFGKANIPLQQSAPWQISFKKRTLAVWTRAITKSCRRVFFVMFQEPCGKFLVMRYPLPARARSVSKQRDVFLNTNIFHEKARQGKGGLHRARLCFRSCVRARFLHRRRNSAPKQKRHAMRTAFALNRVDKKEPTEIRKSAGFEVIDRFYHFVIRYRFAYEFKYP